MLHWRWKIVVMVALLALSVANIFWTNYGYAALLFLLILLPALLLVKHEYVLLALYEMRKQNIAKAIAHLNKIQHPEKVILIKSEVAYYYFLKGVLQVYNRDFLKSEVLIKKSIDLGLKNHSDLAMAYLQMAGIYAQRRQLQMATQFLKQAKKYDKKNLLREQITLFEQQLKAPTQQIRYR